jgi:hypothetical protein
VTGEKSGIVVLDFDERNGGLDSLREWERDHGELPETVQVVTGSGGGSFHAYYRYPGFPVKCEKLAPGIDLKADGGYVMYPGAKHRSGRLYEWEAAHHPQDIEIADLPDWLLDVLQSRTSTTSTCVALPADLAQLPPIDIRLVTFNGKARKFLLDGAPLYERSEAIRAVELKMIEEGYDNTMIAAAILTSPLGDKPREHRDPLGWLAADIGRARAKAAKMPSSGTKMRSSGTSTSAPGTIAASGPVGSSAGNGAPQQGNGSAVPPPPPPPPPSTSGAGAGPVAGAGRPRIRVSGRHLRDKTGDALAALAAINDPPTLFVRSAELVRIKADENDRPIIEAVREHHLRGELERAADFISVSATGIESPAIPPIEVVRDILTLPTLDFPPLEAIVEIPILRPDGSLFDTPGYDPVTRLVYRPAPGLSIPPIPSSPSASDIEAAKALIDDILCDFPFKDQASKAQVVAFMLTPPIRHVTGNPPVFVINKPQQGAGAGLLTAVITLVTTGRPAAMTTPPETEEEWRKVILAKLIEGSTVNVFDNVPSALDSAALASVLTAQQSEGRVLGHSANIVVPNRATWSVNGNNVELRGDLPRRAVWIDIDPGLSRPWLRPLTVFKHPKLLEYVEERRGEILAAIFTLIRAWYGAGKPAAKVPMIGSFERWTETVGGILAHAGVDGFLANIGEKYDTADDESRQWTVFLRTWIDVYGDRELLAKEVAADTQPSVLSGPRCPELFDALPDELAAAAVAKGGNYPRRLGKAFGRHRNHRYGDKNLYLTEGNPDSAKGHTTWKVVGP